MFVAPSSWTPQPPDQNCVLVELAPSAPEYSTVKDRLAETMPLAVITKVERVQNIGLWDYYCIRRQKLRKELSADPKEVSVWHGTSRTDPSLIYTDRKDGFMVGYAWHQSQFPSSRSF